jgi:hypothetical protein
MFESRPGISYHRKYLCLDFMALFDTERFAVIFIGVVGSIFIAVCVRRLSRCECLKP